MAWAYVMRQSPMLANPHEFRENLWQLIVKGEMTEEMKAKQAEAAIAAAKAGKHSDAPTSAKNEMADLLERAKALREGHNE